MPSLTIPVTYVGRPSVRSGCSVTHRYTPLRTRQAQREVGLQRRLVTLVLDAAGGPTGEAPPLHGGEVLLRDGVPMGIVRSTAYGHSMGATIVTGYVACPEELPKITLSWLREGAWAVGSKCNAVLPATLHLKPPFDPDGKRMRGEYD